MIGTRIAVAALAGALVVQAQTCDDPYDHTLCVPTLQASDEASFSVSDNALSSFWGNWTGNDYIDLISPDNCYPDRCGFVGTDDATLMVKAAASTRGLYLLVEVNDNTWVDRADANDWGADAVDLYLDARAPNDIATCTGCLIGMYSSSLTYTTRQFFVWMGGSSLPDGALAAHYDDNLWSWQSATMTWEQLQSQWGMHAEVVSIDATRKAQEWFLPWDRFGGDFVEGASLAGRQLGLSGGYNDKDGDNSEPHCLRWLTRDPWATDATSTNYWGTLQLADDIGPVAAASAVHPRSGVVPAQGSCRQAGSAAGRYSLAGQRVAGARSMHTTASGVYVARAADGRTVRLLPGPR